MTAPTDALSHVLRTVRFRGVVFFDLDASAPWAAEAPQSATIADAVFPGTEHVIEYHVVTRGTCWGGIVGEPPVRLEAGDVIAFPHGDAHVLSSEPGLRGDAAPIEATPEIRLPIALDLRRGPAEPSDVHVVCGFVGCDARPFNPLLASLPRLLKASAGQGPRGNWIEQFVRYAVAETRDARAGSECVLTKLSELMFLEIVRLHLESTSAERAGWLAGLRDPQVGRALAKMHERPGAPWTLEELARVAGMSRSVFAERFAEIVGIAPMQYLTRWRMQVASDLITRGATPFAQIAGEVGYESEAAFHRAFKKVVGTSPGAWRKQRSARV